MGLHSPFGYVGYGVQFGEIMIKLLTDLCGGCHTDEDYIGGCKECSAGRLIYECREYLLSIDEPDKRYEMYASEKWQAKRESLYGHRDSPESIAENKRLAELTKPEGKLIRAIKAEVKKIEPHCFFHSQWIWEDTRLPNPLLRLTELIKDIDFINNARYMNLTFRCKLDKTMRAKTRRIFDVAKLRYDEKMKKETKKE